MVTMPSAKLRKRASNWAECNDFRYSTFVTFPPFVTWKKIHVSAYFLIKYSYFQMLFVTGY